jgi:hypothetical protein
MERNIHSMNRSQLLNGLQTHKKYKKLTQKEIGTKLGNIQNLREELKRLDTSTMKRKNKNVINNSLNIFENKDTLYNILLQSDSNTLINMCRTNILAKRICDDKSFWIDKFNQYNFYLPILDGDETYLKMFDWIHDNVKNTEIILKINDIEKNRKYNKTDGIIDVLIEDMTADNLDALFNMKFERDEHGFMNYNEIRFQLKKKGYFVSLRKVRDKSVDIGYKSISEIKKIFTYALVMTGICADNKGMSFLSMDDEAFEEDAQAYINNLNASETIILCVRRGLWEGMLTDI